MVNKIVNILTLHIVHCTVSIMIIHTCTFIYLLLELEELFLPRGFTNDESPKYKANLHGNEDDDVLDNMKPSFISFKYAFNLMPKLRVFPQAHY